MYQSTIRYQGEWIREITQTREEGNQQIKQEQHLNYDPLEQIIDQHEPKKTSWGNPKGENIQIENDRLLAYKNNTYKHSEAGNLIKKQASEGTHYYTYDGFHQLVRHEYQGKITYYQYDALGRRAAKFHNRQVTRYFWENDRIIGESLEGEDFQPIYQWYIYLPENTGHPEHNFKPFLLIRNNQIYQFHLDHRGAPIALSDCDGNLVWQASYDLNGKAAEQYSDKAKEKGVIQPLRMPGQYEDKETGLYYNRHRYFDPETGRFIQQDPLGLAGSINPYQYCPNVIRWTDPLGLSCNEEDKPDPRSQKTLLYHTDNPITPPKSTGSQDVAKTVAEAAVGPGLSQDAKGKDTIEPKVDVEAPNTKAGQIKEPDNTAVKGKDGFEDILQVGIAQKNTIKDNDSVLRKCKIKSVDTKKSRNLSLIHQRGYIPKSAERSLSKKEYKSLRSELRARVSLETVGGHGHARHGAHTTMDQQEKRIQIKIAPDGAKAPTPRATKFDSNQAELEAVRRAESQFNKNNNLNPYPTTITTPKGKVKPNTISVIVGGRKGGYGSGLELVRDENGVPLPERPVQPSGQDPRAKVIFRYNVKTDNWEKITQYPTND